MSLRKFVSHVTKEGHRKKKSMSLDNNCLQMGNTCNKHDEVPHLFYY